MVIKKVLISGLLLLLFHGICIATDSSALSANITINSTSTTSTAAPVETTKSALTTVESGKVQNAGK